MTPPAWARAHLRPGEEALWWARPSPLGVFPILLSTALAAVGVAGATYLGLDEPGQIFTGTPALILAAGGILVELARRLVRLFFASFVITHDRLYAVTSFFTTDVRSVPLSRVSRVSLRQGPLARLFGLWTARVSAYGEARTSIQVPAIRDGAGLLREASDGMVRGANADWLVRGD